MKTIILIGNGPSATRYPIGHKINLFDEVVRFNNYVIDGYEEFVGSKTTIWIRNNTQTVKPRNENQFSRVLVCPKADGNEEYEPEGKQEKIPNFHKEYNLPKGKWLSTGILGILYLTKEFPITTIHGFDFFQVSKHHYFNKSLSSKKARFHLGQFESQEVNKLVRMGLVKFLSPIVTLL
jgi:hypothetical protein